MQKAPKNYQKKLKEKKKTTNNFLKRHLSKVVFYYAQIKTKELYLWNLNKHFDLEV